MLNFRDYLEAKRIVESERNLTIHDVIINEAKMKDTWHNLYFRQGNAYKQYYSKIGNSQK